MATVYDTWMKGKGRGRTRSPRYGTRPESRYQVRFTDPGSGRQRVESFPTKDAAELRRAEVQVQLRQGLYRPPAAETMAGLWAAYAAAQGWRASTRVQQESRWRTHLAPVLGELRVDRVGREHVRAVEARMAGAGLAAGTRRVVLSLLRSVLQYAVDEGLTATNPATSARGQARGTRPVDRVLTPGEVRALHGRLEELQPAIAQMFETALGTGARVGELRGLTVDRLDLDATPPTVRLDRQLTQDAPPVWGPPKGRARTVPITDALAEMLRDRVGDRTAGFVWASPRDRRRPINARSISEWMARAAAEAGVEVPAGQGMHAARHYYASALLHAGVSVPAVARLLGHATPAVTMSTYAHLLTDDPAGIVAAFEPLDPLRAPDSV